MTKKGILDKDQLDQGYKEIITEHFTTISLELKVIRFDN